MDWAGLWRSQEAISTRSASKANGHSARNWALPHWLHFSKARRSAERRLFNGLGRIYCDVYSNSKVAICLRYGTHVQRGNLRSGSRHSIQRIMTTFELEYITIRPPLHSAVCASEGGAKRRRGAAPSVQGFIIHCPINFIRSSIIPVSCHPIASSSWPQENCYPCN
jgi:hypothetical protein